MFFSREIINIVMMVSGMMVINLFMILVMKSSGENVIIVVEIEVVMEGKIFKVLLIVV